ncbi:hypothetical protein NDU88_007176 [Pleurodeles waltl]|uniref:Uncharacterized protein n=1 Tax=Pleurodeles waltl TaxID=8319 RepID=A0AAV7VNY5_PLEWA|nr:hypothetical protein NDU88_007176 [Pleurodeles waltl]
MVASSSAGPAPGPPASVRARAPPILRQPLRRKDHRRWDPEPRAQARAPHSYSAPRKPRATPTAEITSSRAQGEPLGRPTPPGAQNSKGHRRRARTAAQAVSSGELRPRPHSEAGPRSSAGAADTRSGPIPRCGCLTARGEAYRLPLGTPRVADVGRGGGALKDPS